MKKVLILEDNKAHMSGLRKILSSLSDIQIFEAYNVADANYMLSLHDFNVFLIDIILDTKNTGDVSGIDFVNELRNNKKYLLTPVIFITSLEDPKLCAYKELHCYNYIEKPFDPKEILKTVEEALKIPIPLPKKEYVYFRKDGILYSVKVDEIVYVLISRKGVEVHTNRDCLRLGYHSVSDMLRELNSTDFVQCNRNTIVNKDYIDYVDLINRYIKLRGVDNRIEIGSVMKRQLKSILCEEV